MNIKIRKLSLLAVLCLIGMAILFTSNRTSTTSKPALEYVVQEDDTCLGIVTGFGVSVISIIETNDLEKDCSDLHTGQILQIPYPTPTPPGSPGPTSIQVVIDCEIENYTVRYEDTLESIANHYMIPGEAIVNHNGLINEELEEGMQLVIPLCISTVMP